MKHHAAACVQKELHAKMLPSRATSLRINSKRGQPSATAAANPRTSSRHRYSIAARDIYARSPTAVRRSPSLLARHQGSFPPDILLLADIVPDRIRARRWLFAARAVGDSKQDTVEFGADVHNAQVPASRSFSL